VTESVDALAAELKRGLSKFLDLHTRAAVQLLIDHGVWLGHDDFVSRCICRSEIYPGEASILWAGVSQAVEAGVLDASVTELAVLDFAVALAQDRYRLSLMDRPTMWRLITAFGGAMGVSTQ
jgi:hypothetical protein